MTLEKAIETLERYQSWRLGDDTDILKHRNITESIDMVLKSIKEFKSKLKDCLPNGGYVVHGVKNSMYPTFENDKP